MARKLRENVCYGSVGARSRTVHPCDGSAHAVGRALRSGARSQTDTQPPVPLSPVPLPPVPPPAMPPPAMPLPPVPLVPTPSSPPFLPTLPIAITDHRRYLRPAPTVPPPPKDPQTTSAVAALVVASSDFASPLPSVMAASVGGEGNG